MIQAILGTLLRGVHAGEKHLSWNSSACAAAPEVIEISSDDFAAGAIMPKTFAGKGVGENISPSLKWTKIPPGAVELVLLMEDPDAPMPKPFVHLVVTGISPSVNGFATGSLVAAAAPSGVVYGKDTLGRLGYNGPRAPKGHGPHRYLFGLYALNKKLDFSKPPSLAEVVKAMEGAVIGRGKLEGVFEQK